MNKEVEADKIKGWSNLLNPLNSLNLLNFRKLPNLSNVCYLTTRFPKPKVSVFCNDHINGISYKWRDKNKNI